MLALITVLATDPKPGPYLAVMVLGFVVGAFGHIYKANLIIAIGIGVIALTTLFFIQATNPQLGGG